ncbi:MAG: hydrogenase formation protein HypD [bacterium]
MKNPVEEITKQIKNNLKEPVALMEVCGTHTMAIARAGIRKLMPKNLKLLSGPGCPVCVTPQEIIDWTIELARQKDVIITTFGDMVRVPGSRGNLEIYHPQVVYSPRDALIIAQDKPHKDVVFIGVGFETTSPAVAATIVEAAKKNIKNFYIIPAFKLIPPALEFIVQSPEIKINGFILPGHVSTILGSNPYKLIAEEYHIPGCITGFEPIDILLGIKNLVEQIDKKQASIEIEYKRVVKPEGNITALKLLDEVFEPIDSLWRGIGMIPKSGLRLKKAYQQFDATRKYDIDIPKPYKAKGCICGKILLGVKTPPECPLFGKKCTPSNPVGACMVSSEGSCAAYYRYGEK